MHMDNSVLLTLALNIGLLLAFSWLGIKLLNNYSLIYGTNTDQDNLIISKTVHETAVIIPRLKKELRIRRMIKSNADNDEIPFFPLS